MTKPKNEWIQTFSGLKFFLHFPSIKKILITDIAHHLSQLCRFNGATKEFYSVAQHSVLVSSVVSQENKLWGLLHDASEAYVGDMVYPLKVSMNKYSDAEEKVQRAIARKFKLPWPIPEEVIDADKRILSTEKRDLLEYNIAWTTSKEPYSEIINPLHPQDAEKLFLETFNSLSGSNLI